MAFPLIPLAISLASKFIPDLVSSALDSKTAGKVASKVIEAATTATGLEPEEALNTWDPSHNEQEALKGTVLDVLKLEMGDAQHARENTVDIDMTKNIAYGIMYLNMLLIAGLIGGFAWLLQAGLGDGITGTLGALIGGALNQLYQERQQVVGFLYGLKAGLGKKHGST